jgi:AraC-like DNA-binding protein
MEAPDQYSKQYIYRRLVKAKLFIDKNFAGCIDLNQIAGKAHFSKFHFIRLFRTIYGKTPNQYLTSVRIEKAKELFQLNATINDVCCSVGFDSVSSFKGLFKRYTHSTPAAYKKRQSDLRIAMKKTPLKFIPHCLTQISSTDKKAIFKTTIEL